MKVRICLNLDKPKSRTNLRCINRILKARRIKVVGCGEDMVLAFGGDGSILKAVRSVTPRKTPVLGINTGGLGFLTDIGIDELDRVVRHLVQGKYTIENRMMLECNIGPRRFYALNDFVVTTNVPGRSIELLTSIDGEYLCRFISDGIIVATPTGSTAYSLAASGPIIKPTMRAIVISPICPHTLSVRPLVLDERDVFEVQIGSKGEAVLVTDGQLRQRLTSGRKISFHKSEHQAYLVKAHSHSFIDTLRKKMKWGGREDA